MFEASKIAEQLLNNPQYKFHLGGSRRMAQLHPSVVQVKDSTDYDLYATYTESLADWLELKAGFVITHNGSSGYPLDDEANLILVHEENNGVQVVLRKDDMFYKSVFESIPPKYYRTYLWKSSPDFTALDTCGIMATFNAFFAIAHARGTTPTVNPDPVVRDPLKAYAVAMKGII